MCQNSQTNQRNVFKSRFEKSYKCLRSLGRWNTANFCSDLKGLGNHVFVTNLASPRYLDSVTSVAGSNWCRLAPLRKTFWISVGPQALEKCFFQIEILDVLEVTEKPGWVSYREMFCIQNLRTTYNVTRTHEPKETLTKRCCLPFPIDMYQNYDLGFEHTNIYFTYSDLKKNDHSTAWRSLGAREACSDYKSMKAAHTPRF